ncbi:hypothetical protein BKA56DRAFT_12100 [Ilyonectria sp. MPI-CAGE-AT-0026]|nr:hypothetical protein BKA56DRAFT_12100 [Ilyonectria sp. MPI-CAGE-AT-0026]
MTAANTLLTLLYLTPDLLPLTSLTAISRLHASETHYSSARSPRFPSAANFHLPSIHIHIHVYGHHQPNQLRPVRSDAEPRLGGPLSQSSRCPCDASSFKYNTRPETWTPTCSSSSTRHTSRRIATSFRHPHSRISPCYPHHALTS